MLRQANFTLAWKEEGELFTFGLGEAGQLGHGEGGIEFEPRLVEALVGKKVIGASAGGQHTAAWTEAGEPFTFGKGTWGMGWCPDQPRLVEAPHGAQPGERGPPLVPAPLAPLVHTPYTCPCVLPNVY